jgi:hypothetical protein
MRVFTSLSVGMVVILASGAVIIRPDGITSLITGTGVHTIGPTGGTITEPITTHLKDITTRDAITGGIVYATIIKGAIIRGVTGM